MSHSTLEDIGQDVPSESSSRQAARRTCLLKGALRALLIPLELCLALGSQGVALGQVSSPRYPEEELESESTQEAGITPGPAAPSAPAPQKALPSRRPAASIDSRSTSEGYLGLVLHTRGGVAFVKRVIPGWPAEKGGLLPGDLLLEVDGRSAQGPLLGDAIDALSGPASSKVVVTVLRPGEDIPRSISLLRTDERVPPPIPLEPPGPSEEERARALVQSSLSAFSRGRTAALEPAIAYARRAPVDEGSRVLLELGDGLLDLGGKVAWEAAIELAELSVELFPESSKSVDLARDCYSSGDREGTALKALSERALVNLNQPSRRLTTSVRARAASGWEGLIAVAEARAGRERASEERLERLVTHPIPDLVVMKPLSGVVWQREVAPSFAWRDTIDFALTTGREALAERGVETVLELDEPSWIYPMIAELTAGERFEPYLVPRWPLERVRYRPGPLKDTLLKSVTVKDLVGGTPTLVLECTPYTMACEDWRVALSDVLGRVLALEVKTLIVNGDGSAPPPTSSWPVYAGGKEAPPRLVLLDDSGGIVGTYGAYEHGLEWRLLRQVKALYEDPEGAGPYVLRGGIDQHGWTLRWTRWEESVADFDVSRTPAPYLFLLNPRGRLEVLEEGDSVQVLEGLTRINRLRWLELDSDAGFELLAWEKGGSLLEALDGGPTPVWIAPPDAPLRVVEPAYLRTDSRAEVLLAKDGENFLYCYSSRGALLWQTRLEGGIRQVAVGRSIWTGPLIAVVTLDGRVVLVSAQGKVITDVNSGVDARIAAWADLDGDLSDELVVGTDAVRGLTIGELNDDGYLELALRVGDRQLLVIRADGKVASRLTWEESDLELRSGDVDGDKQLELMLASKKGDVTFVNWLDSARASE